MKFFSLIIGALVLYLSVMPCCAGERPCVEGEKESHGLSAEAEDGGNELPCSPFFSCGGCPGFSPEKHTGFTTGLPEILLRSEVVLFEVSQSDGFFLSLIKPPSADSMPLS